MKKSTVVKLVQQSSKIDFTKEEVLFMLNEIDSLEESNSKDIVKKPAHQIWSEFKGLNRERFREVLFKEGVIRRILES